MRNTETFDLVIIGAGSAGLVVAAVAASLKFKVALLEGDKMGGDCLNYGCVPSKALLSAARKVHTAKQASTFGLKTTDKVDFKAVMKHVHDGIARIAPHDSEERFSGMGVEVIREHGSFEDAHTVITKSGRRLVGKRIIVATGSRAMVPPIKGIDTTPYLTNETIFELKTLPEHLIIIGGGPIGVEMGQAFNRLGAKVSLVEAAPTILGKDDPELATVARAQVMEEGVHVYENHTVADTAKATKGVTVTLKNAEGKTVELKGSHLLIAAGRAPNVDGIGLENTGVDYSKRGIPTSGAMRTNIPHIYAAGDVTGPYQFTHMAGYQAGLIIRRTLFGGLTTKPDYKAVPWVTYTSPELANVGLTEAQARTQYGDSIKVVRVPFDEVDRARAEGDTKGLLKVITTKRGKILGAGMVGTHAGELIHEWATFVQLGLNIRHMNSIIHAYPTRAEINKKAASAYYKEAFYSKGTRRLSHFLFKLLG